MTFVTVRSNFADAVTGERIFPGERIFDTGYMNVMQPYLDNGRTRYLKEETIVELAKAAGIKVCDGNCSCGVDESDGGVSEPASVVGGEDVGVGSGKGKVGKA